MHDMFLSEHSRASRDDGDVLGNESSGDVLVRTPWKGRTQAWGAQLLPQGHVLSFCGPGAPQVCSPQRRRRHGTRGGVGTDHGMMSGGDRSFPALLQSYGTVAHVLSAGDWNPVRRLVTVGHCGARPVG